MISTRQVTYFKPVEYKQANFSQHILSRKHRRFAENDDNWGELDSLISQIKRLPKDAMLEEGWSH